jgi:hypothetical protein
MNVKRLICFFCVEGRLRGIQAGLHTRSAAPGRMNVGATYNLRWRADSWIQAGRTRAAPVRHMNVGASYIFCVGGPTAWIQAGLHTRSAALKTA